MNTSSNHLLPVPLAFSLLVGTVVTAAELPVQDGNAASKSQVESEFGGSQLFTRTYRLPPEAMRSLDLTSPPTVSSADTLRSPLLKAGIDFANPAGKAFFYNDRTGVLMVRATKADLDIVEQALKPLNAAPPQVKIEMRVAEITGVENKAVGFDWYVGNVSIDAGQVGLQAGNPRGIFADPTVLGETNQPAKQGAPLSGILTEPQFKVVIRALEQREGVDLISAPTITTLSGRKARIQVVETTPPQGSFHPPFTAPGKQPKATWTRNPQPPDHPEGSAE